MTLVHLKRFTQWILVPVAIGAFLSGCGSDNKNNAPIDAPPSEEQTNLTRALDDVGLIQATVDIEQPPTALDASLRPPE